MYSVDEIQDLMLVVAYLTDKGISSPKLRCFSIIIIIIILF